MAGKSRRNLLAAVVAAPFAGGTVARSSSFDDTSRRDLQERHFPNFELTTHEGKRSFLRHLIKRQIVVIISCMHTAKGHARYTGPPFAVQNSSANGLAATSLCIRSRSIEA